MEAVRDHLLGQVEPGRGPATIRKDKLYNNIPWTDVCRRVKTCHRDQCRMKWLNAMQVEYSADIDWEEIAHTVGGVTPICYVQMHYHKLKVAKVPLQQSMSFCEIIDFLYSSVLPQFEELLCHSQAESGETIDKSSSCFQRSLKMRTTEIITARGLCGAVAVDMGEF
ncbi:transcription termination factor 1 [Salmo trutta]|uniref:transcription termination factor 1 n=1 Tax=Salmo trutta TaxID=8032 RepID=UPI0011310C63|nr:transcription termination factor 1-like [Salmo trutta]XP_029602251.1 transcription termination factor 1-like [Salmo trutta]